MRVSRRLAMQALVSLVAVLMAASVGLWAASRLTALGSDVINAKDMVADVLPPPLYLIETRLVVSQTLEGLVEPEAARQRLQRLKQDHETRVQHWRDEPIAGLPEGLLDAQYRTAYLFMDAAARVVDTVAAGQREAAVAMLPDLNALYLAHRQAVDRTVQVATQLADTAIEGLNAVIDRSQWLLWATLVVTVLFTALLSFCVVRSIVAPLREAIQSVRHVAAGDLSRELTVQGRDELSELQGALRDMQQSLSGIVQAVRANADSVATASSQISEGNNDLCHRTEAQASALQATAATMEQLGATVRSNAEYAREASQLAQGARVVAEQGGQVMARVIDNMDSLSESARRIEEIVGVINAIAFQTNILALNAAVEAARAGEQGRGFAVVAAEVRMLSQRSAQSAREIQDLITACTQQVAAGSGLVDEAGRTMERIVSAIRDVNSTVLQISSASGEQSASVTQVGATVSRLDESTQRNAALVVESAAAAQSLQAQSAQLVQMVQSFVLRCEH
jgi:methyl-accepting chemotaxis protein